MKKGLLLIIILTGASLLLWGCSGKDASSPESEQDGSLVDAGDEITIEDTEVSLPFFKKERGFRALAFVLDGSLTNSIKKYLPESEPYSEFLAAQLIKAMFWDLDHRRDLRKGDRCKAVYKPTKDRFKIRLYGVEYYSQKRERTYRYYFFWEKDAKFPEYFSEVGDAVAKRMKNCPLKRYDDVISLFRSGVKSRRGIKFRVKTGTKVYMPLPAMVDSLNWDMDNLGLSVRVRYPGTGVMAEFLHLSAISEDIEPGKAVTVGAAFARTGVSGKTKTPHLEYRLYREGEKGPQWIDPYEFHGSENYAMNTVHYSDFVSVKHQIRALKELVDYPDKSTD